MEEVFKIPTAGSHFNFTVCVEIDGSVKLTLEESTFLSASVQACDKTQVLSSLGSCTENQKSIFQFRKPLKASANWALWMHRYHGIEFKGIEQQLELHRFGWFALLIQLSRLIENRLISRRWKTKFVGFSRAFTRESEDFWVDLINIGGERESFALGKASSTATVKSKPLNNFLFCRKSFAKPRVKPHRRILPSQTLVWLYRAPFDGKLNLAQQSNFSSPNQDRSIRI